MDCSSNRSDKGIRAPLRANECFQSELRQELEKKFLKKRKISDPKVEAVFERAISDLPNNFFAISDGGVYVQTGDISAEWLRDSSAQLELVVEASKNNAFLRNVARGAIATQWRDICADSYANAFKSDGKLWERKFELDSISSPEILAWKYWKTSNDTSIFTSQMQKGLQQILSVMELEQNHANSSYRFTTLPNSGTGSPVKTTGMIWTGFRPSDDACKYNYNIPQEMLATSALRDIAEIEQTVYHDSFDAKRAERLAAQVHAGIEKYGVVDTREHGKIYAYEVDGLGHHLLADDANVPNLLSAPLNYKMNTIENMIYANTQTFVLSKNNPEYFQGKFAHGEGSAHTPVGYVWPLGLVTEGLTATTSSARKSLIKELVDTTPDDRLHESFDPNCPNRLTRKDFAWPNAEFIELVSKTYP